MTMTPSFSSGGPSGRNECFLSYSRSFSPFAKQNTTALAHPSAWRVHNDPGKMYH